MRLHEAAKTYKLEQKELVALLAKLGFQVKAHAFTAVTEDMQTALDKHVKAQSAPAAKPATGPAPSAKAVEPAAKPVAKAPAKPEVRPVAKPEPKVEAKHEPKHEPKPAPKPEAKHEVKPAPRPENRQGSQPLPPRSQPTTPSRQNFPPPPPFERKGFPPAPPLAPKPVPVVPPKPVAAVPAPIQAKPVPTPTAPVQRPVTPPTVVSVPVPVKEKKHTGPKPYMRDDQVEVEVGSQITIIKTAPVKKEAPPKKIKKLKQKNKIVSKKVLEEARQELKAFEGSGPATSSLPQSSAEPEVYVPRVTVPPDITVSELARYLEVQGVEIVKKLMGMGVFASLNQRLERAQIETVTADYGKKAVFSEDVVELEETPDEPEQLQSRPPIVTIMGHVDHGKTSLLDRIRHARVAEGEFGGITQHIGAYQVKTANGLITFLDTPGHEAFTAMRAQGAQVTDIAILVVAADDGVQPQTVEALHHAQAANCPIIVAVNKIDKPESNAEKVKQQLMPYNLVAEEWGGKTIMVQVSARRGDGVDQLLEMVLLQAEMMELKANPDKPGTGTIIEAKLDKGMGPMATLMIRGGTVRVGDSIICGTCYGRVKALIDDAGQRVKEAGPATPVVILGLNEVPRVGDRLQVVETTKFARYVGMLRLKQEREERLERDNRVKLTNIFDRVAEGNIKELGLVIKADVQGSAMALKDSLERLSNPEIKVKVIHAGVGAITESDVMLAAASNAIVVGFHVRPAHGVDDVATRENVDIKVYRIIYDAIDAVKAALKGMYEPVFEEEIMGRAEIRRPYRISGVGMVAGSYVLEGKVSRDASVRVIRDGVEVYEGKVCSLKRFKDDVREVAAGFECGIGVSNYGDLKEKDVLELFRMREIPRI